MGRKLVFCVLLFVFPLMVNAACTNQDLIRYKNLASNLNSYYDYDEESNVFNATVQNLHNDLYLLDYTNNIQYRNNGLGIGDINIYSLSPGSRVTLKAYVVGGECEGYNVYTLYLNIPYYNSYYNDSVCVNNNNSLCSKWANTSNLTYEQFVEKVKITSEEEKKAEQEPEKEVRKYGFFDFLGDYYIYILLAIIVFGSYGIYVLDKKSKFDF